MKLEQMEIVNGVNEYRVGRKRALAIYVHFSRAGLLREFSTIEC